MSANSEGSRTIQSVQRALMILNLFTDATPELSLGEISAALNLNKSTAHGLVNTLYQNRYINKNRVTGKYMLGPALLSKISYSQVQRDAYMLQSGLSHMRKMVDDFNSTVMLWSYHNHALVNLKTISPSMLYPYEYKPVMDYHCAVSPQVMLTTWRPEDVAAYFQHTHMTKYTENTITTLPELMKKLEVVRATGAAEEYDEIIVGLSAVSVPIWNEDHSLMGTVSHSCSTETLRKNRVEMIAALKHTAEHISRCMQQLNR